MSQKERDSMRETVYVCMCVKERGTENVFIFFSGKKLKKKTKKPEVPSEEFEVFRGICRYCFTKHFGDCRCESKLFSCQG